MKENIIQTNLAQIQQLMRMHQVRNAYAFTAIASRTGPKIKGTYFFVLFEDNLDYHTYSDHYVSLLQQLEALLHCKVDLLTKETLEIPFILKIMGTREFRVL